MQQRVIQHRPAKRNPLVSSLSPTHQLRPGAYTRVSTMDEDQLESFANQIEHYRNYADRHPEYRLVDIYADEGITGTNTKRRKEFKRLISDCEHGLIDVVITKSISRFARNTQDCLHYARKLKDLGIPVIFERENLNTMDGTGELLFTILSSLAQDESRSISENTSWGIRARFREGKLHLNANNLLGYDMDENGMLVINEEQARIVERIYNEFLNGINPATIANRLNVEQIPGVSGKPCWHSSTILSILRNEKYMGDSILQKYITVDYLSHRVIPNDGSIESYYIANDHHPIVSPFLWKAAQLELQRQQLHKEKYNLRAIGRYADDNPFSNHVICGVCGQIYGRRTWYREQGPVKVWICKERYKEKGAPGCQNETLREKDLFDAFVILWNKIIDTRNNRLPIWKKNAASDNELISYRASQMIRLTESQQHVTAYDPSLLEKVLDRVVVLPLNRLEFHLLDGTMMVIGYNK